MKVFLTGATGYIGSLVGEQLKAAGHTVVGLAQAARSADGVIHTAFIHDFSDFEGAVKVEEMVIATFVDALADSGKPFVATSGTGLLGDTGDRLIDDTEIMASHNALIPRASAEQAIIQASKQNIRSVVVRLPIFVYGYGASQFIPILINDAKRSGVARYVGQGDYQYSAIHVDDVAKLYVLALEKGQAGSVYHAVSDSGITIKAITEAVFHLLGCGTKEISKEEAIQEWGGFLTTFFSINNQVSCTRAKVDLGWQPASKTTILEDIEFGSYSLLKL